jgi:hypothetical protein
MKHFVSTSTQWQYSVDCALTVLPVKVQLITANSESSTWKPAPVAAAPCSNTLLLTVMLESMIHATPPICPASRLEQTKWFGVSVLHAC